MHELLNGGTLLKHSICIDMMYKEIPFYERFDAVHRMGYDSVEIWKWSKRDITRIKQISEELNVKIALINVDNQTEEISERLWQGITSCKEPQDFIESFKQTVDVCNFLGIKKTVVLGGNLKPGITIEKQREALRDLLNKVVNIAEKNEITIVLEPLDTNNRPLSILSRSSDGFNIIRDIKSPSLKLLYDIYHQQKTEGNIIDTITNNIELIGHIHVADVPGRHEPGTGEINYSNIFSVLNSIGYTEYVGLEFIPSTNTGDSLKRFNKYIRGSINE